MNDYIEMLEFDGTLLLEQSFALCASGSETRQQLKECTQLPWDTTPRHSEEV